MEIRQACSTCVRKHLPKTPPMGQYSAASIFFAVRGADARGQWPDRLAWRKVHHPQRRAPPRPATAARGEVAA
eukprot:5640577-Pleurochrysis_carterae.AAC.3